MFISAEEDLLKPDESKALINKPIEASEVITQSKIPNANLPKIKKEEPEQIKANEKTDVALEKESPKSIHLFPDVITPNQDGANDSFYIDMDVPVLYQLTISSSSGQTFFVSTNPKEKWDGKYNGRMMPYGFYIATLVYQFNPESKAESKTQLIELKRNK